MNITIEQFIEGLERSVRELPSILEDWDGLDDELREGYTEQLLWLLKSRAAVLANVAGTRHLDAAQRIATATAALCHLKRELDEVMGITSECIVPYVTFTAAQRDGSVATMSSTTSGHRHMAVAA